MTHEQYEAVAGELMALARDIELAKRPGYTNGADDVLVNFKRVAERTGLTPGQVLAVYLLKHVDAITALMTRPDLPVAEAAQGRFSDAINYLRLGYALWHEAQDAKRPITKGE